MSDLVRMTVKVGGSLYDLPDLGPRLRHWLALQPASAVLIVPGGGSTAEAVRDLDRLHQLGEERAHWLALAALTLNACFLADLLASADKETRRPGDKETSNLSLSPCLPVSLSPCLAVLDAFAFASQDEGQPGCLPHTWAVTSDSVAARAALVGGAEELVLLKSTDLPEGMNWETAAERGLVDRYFATVVRGGRLRVRFVNLRTVTGP